MLQMRRLPMMLATCLFALSMASWAQDNQVLKAAAGYTPVLKYDPTRDASKDISEANAEAKRTGKRVLIQVGGDWASWCHTLDTFFETHTDLRELRDANYVTVDVNFSRENQNKKVLAQYGQIIEYPHLFVTDADGKVLVSQWTSPFEKGETYDPEKFRAFLVEWSPPRPRK
jgi:thioredoxin-related protein